MQKSNQLKRDKLKFAAQLLFELPPADTLPILKRLSFDHVKVLLDQLKQDTPEGRGPRTSNSLPTASNNQSTSNFFLTQTPELNCRVLQYEAPTTIAKALSLMSPDAARETLKCLPARTRELTTQAIINLPSISDEEAIQLQLELKQKLNRHLDDDVSDTTQQPIATDEPERQTRFHINDQLAPHATDSDTTSPLAGMKRFALLTDSEIKAILKHCDTSFWAPALKNAPVAIQQKIMNCMAPAAVGLLKIEIDKVGDISEQREKLAREGIVHTAVRLATTGQIMLERRNSEVA